MRLDLPPPPYLHTQTQPPPMSNDRPASSGASVPQPPASSGPPSYSSSNYPPVDGVNPANAPPAIDINSLHNSYNQIKASNNQPPILLDMFALMLNLQSKQTENDEMRSELQHNTVRLDAVEAKIGGINDVSERLGLAVRRLPLPPTGRTDLEMFRQVIAELRLQGVDVNRDITKAVRKLPARPGTNPSEPILGTVLVEMRNEDTRAKIMKNKNTLQQHHNEIIRNIIIKNMKSREQMFMENLGNSILKKIPGCENSFVTPNGQIRESNFQQPYNNNSQGNRNHPQHQYQPQHANQQPKQPQNQAQVGPNMTQHAPKQPQHPSNHQSTPHQSQHGPHYPQQAQYRPQQLHSQPQFQHSLLPPQQRQQQPHFQFTNGYQAFPPPNSFPFPSNYPYYQQQHHAQPIQAPALAQVASNDPFQSLIDQLDPLNAQHPSPADPNLHLLQPAEPHYEYTLQEECGNEEDE